MTTVNVTPTVITNSKPTGFKMQCTACDWSKSTIETFLEAHALTHVSNDHGDDLELVMLQTEDSPKEINFDAELPQVSDSEPFDDPDDSEEIMED